MFRKDRKLGRRDFLRAAAGASAAIVAPTIIPATALGLGNRAAPSERIVLGGIGVGNRGRGVLAGMLPEPDIQFVAIADVQRVRRQLVKDMVDKQYGNSDCVMYQNMFDILTRDDIDSVLIATGERWHAMASITTAKAGKDMYCEKPCSMTIADAQALNTTMSLYGRIYQAGTQRRSVGNFVFAAQLALSGKLGKIHTVHANTLAPAASHDWLPAESEPPKEECDWDMWLGPCPWRPYNSKYVAGGWRGHLDFHGGGILEWGSHTVDLCQWAAGADGTNAVDYEPNPTGLVCHYANGVKLVMRPDGWMGLGTCSVRYEGDEGWVEAGDSGQVRCHPASLLGERKIQAGAGTDPAGHGRNFFDCVKSRSLPHANHILASSSHITCHAAHIAWQLGRPLKWDPAKAEFIGDEEANRMRSRAQREPWRY
ncbi:MAG TPA: Gfo/Idh/MocA family oxidoreductase [Verrucomicrobiae bacterium]|nr:Gfo/Idh/MocA family oxidoreductase [Verrucomicrobiae bacterium]